MGWQGIWVTESDQELQKLSKNLWETAHWVCVCVCFRSGFQKRFCLTQTKQVTVARWWVCMRPTRDAPHVQHIHGVPAWNVHMEAGTRSEHVAHILYIADVPSREHQVVVRRGREHPILKGHSQTLITSNHNNQLLHYNQKETYCLPGHSIFCNQYDMPSKSAANKDSSRNEWCIDFVVFTTQVLLEFCVRTLTTYTALIGGWTVKNHLFWNGFLSPTPLVRGWRLTPWIKDEAGMDCQGQESSCARGYTWSSWRWDRPSTWRWVPSAKVDSFSPAFQMVSLFQITIPQAYTLTRHLLLRSYGPHRKHKAVWEVKLRSKIHIQNPNSDQTVRLLSGPSLPILHATVWAKMLLMQNVCVCARASEALWKSGACSVLFCETGLVDEYCFNAIIWSKLAISRAQTGPDSNYQFDPDNTY